MPIEGKDIVVVFGAGATKACGGPLTKEILPEAMSLRDVLDRDGQLELVAEFLDDNFYVSMEPAVNEYPDLPLLLSLIDMARDRAESFGPRWGGALLDRLRESLEFAAFALLEHQLREVPYENPYRVLLRDLFHRATRSLTVVSLNYDIIVDNVLSGLVGEVAGDALPDYACDIATRRYQAAVELRRPSGTDLRLQLLKLHGSLNWMYCANCHRLDLGVARSGRSTVKVLDMLWHMEESLRLEDRYTTRGRVCEDCGARLRALLITPTLQKDYRNPHISRIWYTADRALRQADRVVFVGYSLPHDDVEVAYLFKRGLAHLGGASISVVEQAMPSVAIRDHETGLRYRNLFGDHLDWHPEGFASWVQSVCD